MFVATHRSARRCDQPHSERLSLVKSRAIELEPVDLLAEGTVRPDRPDLYSSIAE